MRICSIQPAAFLDRDGVLNVDSGYVHSTTDFVWVEGAQNAVRLLNQSGYRVFVVTNQSGIARGYFSEADVERLHGWMSSELAKTGGHIDAFYYCPHHPDIGDHHYCVACDCRKPKPGLLNRAMSEWQVKKSASFIIGDKQSDIEAGEAAGIRGFLFPGGNLNQFSKSLLIEFGNTNPASRP